MRVAGPNTGSTPSVIGRDAGVADALDAGQLRTSFTTANEVIPRGWLMFRMLQGRMIAAGQA
jgi:hypothetical protein